MRGKSANRGRSWARRYAMQALYQWQKTGQDVAGVEAQFIADRALLRTVHEAQALAQMLGGFDAAPALAEDRIKWLKSVLEAGLERLFDGLQLDSRTLVEALKLLVLAQLVRQGEAPEGCGAQQREWLKSALEHEQLQLHRQGAVAARELKTRLQQESPLREAHDALLSTDIVRVIREAAFKRYLRQLHAELDARGASGNELAWLEAAARRNYLDPAVAVFDEARLTALVADVALSDRGILDADVDYFRELVRQIPATLETLNATLEPCLDRPLAELDPIERAILWIGVHELSVHAADVPYRVAINEAIELAKRFGAEQGHRFVNGVLDRIAKRLRSSEAGRP